MHGSWGGALETGVGRRVRSIVSLYGNPAIRHLRWYIVALLTMVTAINYLDRNTLSVAQTVLEDELGMTDRDYGRIVSAFLIAYGLVHPISGRIVDWLGSRLGLTVAFIWWSAASVGHAFVGSVGGFATMRFLLGVGESGNFPAAIKTVGEWFPAKERALATGIINVGTGLGALLAPPLAGAVIYYWGWRAAFIVTACVGLVWLVPWLILGRRPEGHPYITPDELEHIRSGQPVSTEPPALPGRGSWMDALARRELWALMLARLLSDPVWLFLSFWIPKYFKAERGFDLKSIAMFTWLPFLAADVGSIVGGWLSSFFIGRGLSVVRARKIAVCISASMMPLTILSVHVDSWLLAIVFLSVAAFGHQSWSASVLTLPADLFPKRITGLCYGFPAMVGILGGALSQWYVGDIIDMFGYRPVFTVAGCLHPVGAMVIVMLIRSRQAGNLEGRFE